jgi:hypothetical protein
MSGASGLRLHHHTGAGDGGAITALSNPMTTLDDIIVGGASGTPARLGKGTDGQALIVDPVTHHLAWGTASAALTDHTHAATGSGSTGGGATLQPGTLILPGSTSPAQTAEGSAVWDTDDDVLTVGTGATRKTFGYFGNTAPSGLGTASAGSGNEAARLTHIHGMPRLDELGLPTADVSLNTHKVTNVTNPASPQDAATKAYVDGSISGAGGLSDHGIVTYLDYQVGAAPATPASGYVRHYAKTGGHIAQKDDAGTESLLDSTGGGSSYPPLDQYTIDGTYGDHFTGASLSGSWTRRNFTSGAETYQQGYNTTYLKIHPNGRAAGDGYFRTAPAGDWTFAMKYIVTGGTAAPGFGPCVVDTAGTGVAIVGMYSGPAPLGSLLVGITTYTTYGGTYREPGISGTDPNVNLWPAYPIGMPIWFYLRKSGTTYFASVSIDGQVWGTESSSLTWTGTVDRVGMMMAPPGTVGGTNTDIFVDWFNKIA